MDDTVSNGRTPGFAGHERRPSGTPERICGTAFPTLKRGANNRCAYGAGLAATGMERSGKRPL